MKKWITTAAIGLTLIGVISIRGKADQKQVQHSVVSIVLGTDNNVALGVSYYSSFGPDVPEIYQGKPLAQVQVELKDRGFALDHADGVFLYYSR